jgi:hypothetical protein
VRNDWDWPSIPGPWSASDEEVRGVVEFRERYYGTSASEESEPKAEGSSGAGKDPYKFDSPDSIGDDVEQKRQSRKRKRRERQEEEMGWNEGLRTFVERRDVWTGAASVRKYGAKVMEATPERLDSGAGSDTTIPPPEASSAKNDPADPLIPLAPRMLRGNPIRESIKETGYTDIYNNIVITQRTPSVPVNLADMTRALVLGWKQNGEWPPKAGPLDPLAGGRRRLAGAPSGVLSQHPHVKRGVDSVKRILHLNGHAHESGAMGKNG